MNRFEIEGARVRATRTWTAVGWMLFTGAVLGVLARKAWLDERHVYSALFVLYAPAAALLFGLWPGWLRQRHAKVTADTRGLVVGDELLPRAAISSARVIVGEDETCVRVWRGAGFVEIDVAGATEGRALVAALALEPDARAIKGARFFLGWGTFRAGVFRSTLLGLTALVAIALLGWRSAPLPLAIGVGFALLGLRDAVLVTVAADGLVVRRLLARSRFVSYDDIASVTIEGKNVVLVLHGGASLTLHDARFAGSSARPFARALTSRLAFRPDVDGGTREVTPRRDG